MSWRLSFLLIGCLLLLSALPASQADEGGVGGTDSDPSSNAQEGSDGSTAGGASGGLRESGEKFQFQAEVTRLMDIIINSLYSNKDIFLRELISNASDALDKIRFLSLTDKSQLGDGEDVNLEVRISIDRDGKLIRIRDRGIGMTKDELVKNLGTIAKSGTSAFLEQMQKGGDVNLIGQFGVGFYSVFLVADHVEVVTKHNDDNQYIWESRADGNFAITEDPEGSVSGEGGLGRGTVLRIHVKDEAQEYLQETKLRQLIAKYSEFINFPIYMHVQKEKEVPVDEEDEDEGVADTDEDVEDEDEEESNDGVEDEDGEGDEEEEEEEVKTEKKKFWEWELLNSQKAIWLRPPSDVSDEEYEKFYKALSKNEWESPMSWAHFKAEGDVEFRSIVYIPPKAPFDFYDNFYQRALGLKLYVRRVFISDEVEELLPRYLGFILGLVDSDTLPLNVSREMLQQHTSLRTIKKKLVRKILDMIRKLSEADKRHRKDVRDEKDGSTDVEDEVEEERSTEEKDADKKDAEKYKEFWSEYGKAIKLGIIEDNANRQRLAKLLRFQTSKSGGELVSLDEYIARMKPDQKHIYYLAGASVDEVASSPFVEKLIAKGYEVIYFTDSVDEYMMQSLLEYEDSKFQNISKEDLELGDMAQLKKAKQEFKPLTSWWKKALASHSEAKNLEGVRVSDRLEQTPCVVVTSKYGWSANMQKIMAAQALGDASRQAYMKGKTWLEINYRHPLIREMLAKVEADSEDKDTQQVATLLYETALMESGFVLEEPKPFAQRVYHLLKAQLGMEGELTDLSPEELDTDTEEDDDGKESESTGDMHVSNDDLDARVEL